MAQLKLVTATIANGASLSGEVAVEWGWRLVGIRTPATMDGTSLTFQAAEGKGGTYQNLHDDGGNEVTVTVAASRHVAVEIAEDFDSTPYIKVRAGTAASPTVQNQETVLTLVLRNA